MNNTIHILHLEDNPKDAELIHSMLVEDGLPVVIRRVDSKEDFIESLNAAHFDLVLCDYNLPSFDGKSALEEFQKRHPDFPFIFVSGTIGEERAIDALKQGATDYVIKDNLERLIPAVRRAIKDTEEKKVRKSLEMQLFHAQRMESIGTLAGGIAHDFNNILGIIMGHASLMERLRNDPVKFSDSLQTLLNASRRGAMLVRQLLTIARKNDITVEPVMLNHAVKEIIKLVRETFSKTISIKTVLDDSLPIIAADSTQLQQVLLNLCVNARDAMPNGGTLTITTRVVEGQQLLSKFIKAKNSTYVVVDIADTGTGMSEETLRRIFEPFFTTKEEGKGTGLGLAVVFGIVDTHNGFIDVASEIGRGSTFSVYFPSAESFAKQKEQKPADISTIQGGSETLLIVEDEMHLKDLLKFVLESKGYTVLTAEDGEEAIDTYRMHASRIHAVLSDFGLPKLDGHDVLKQIKDINPHVLFVLATGYLEPKQHDAMMKMGVKKIIQKPYAPVEVIKIVRDVLDENLKK